MYQQSRPRHSHLFVVGGQRCGSTWLYQQLIRVSNSVGVNDQGFEPKILLTDTSHEQYDMKLGTRIVDGSVIIEKSTSYLETPKVSDLIRREMPDAIILVVLRNPTLRAFSHWRFSRENGFETLEFRDCLSERAEGRTWSGAATSPYTYKTRGQYSRFLKPWKLNFPNLIILQFEKLIATTGYQYLMESIGKYGLIIDESEFNSVGPINESTGKSDVLDVETRHELDTYFQSWNQSLEEYGIDLDLWSSSE